MEPYSDAGPGKSWGQGASTVQLTKVLSDQLAAEKCHKPQTPREPSSRDGDLHPWASCHSPVPRAAPARQELRKALEPDSSPHGGTKDATGRQDAGSSPSPHPTAGGTEGSGLGTLPPPAPAPRGHRAHHGGVRTPRVLAAHAPVPIESPEPGRPAPDPKTVVRRRIRDKGPSKTAKARPLLSVSSPDCTFLTPAPSIGQSFSSHRLRP